MGDLIKLIEAVEAGTATMNDFAAVFPSESAYGKTTWGTAHNAFAGDLNAAKALHDALLPDHGWGAGPWGARVWLYSDHPKWDGSDRQEVEMVKAPARAWLLAILKARAALPPEEQGEG